MGNIKLTLKDVVGIVIYVGMLIGLYYKLSYQVERLQEKVTDQSELNKKYNLEVIDLKLSILSSEVKQLNEKADRINTLLSEP